MSPKTKKVILWIVWSIIVTIVIILMAFAAEVYHDGMYDPGQGHWEQRKP